MAIVDPTGTAFSLEASTASVSFAGAIDHSAAGAAAVSVAGHDQGSVSFTATSSITDSAGTGLQDLTDPLQQRFTYQYDTDSVTKYPTGRLDFNLSPAIPSS